MLRFKLIFGILIAAATSSASASPENRPGQYVLDGGAGSLTIQKGERNELTFDIFTVGDNGHTCVVSGVISGATGHTGGEGGEGSDPKCKISFSADRNSVDVLSITEEECRYYCGARATFDGTYRIPPAACTSAGRQKQRTEYLRMYKDRLFVQAKEAIQSLIAQCNSFMSWVEMDRVRNDLALAQYHSGEFQQCSTTLSETLAAKFKDKEELKINLPPSDFDSYIGVAKATWFNKALCAKAKNKDQ